MNYAVRACGLCLVDVDHKKTGLLVPYRTLARAARRRLFWRVCGANISFLHSSVILKAYATTAGGTHLCAASHSRDWQAVMFFSIPATGKARDKKPKEEPKEAPKEEAPAAQSIPPPPPGPPPPLPPPPAPEEDTPKVDAHAAAAALYPSMRPDYDPAERAADEAPRKRTVVVEDAARPTSVFLSGLPLTVKDSELQQFLRGCGVLQSIKKVRDRGVFNGCAIVTFGGAGPCGNQRGSYVASMAWGA